MRPTVDEFSPLPLLLYKNQTLQLDGGSNPLKRYVTRFSETDGQEHHAFTFYRRRKMSIVAKWLVTDLSKLYEQCKEARRPIMSYLYTAHADTIERYRLLACQKSKDTARPRLERPAVYGTF